MNQLPEPTNPRDIRASDADRHRVAEVLRDAAGEGRLTLEELDERLDGVFAAKTYAELERLTTDLPAVDAVQTPAAAVAPSSSNDFPRVGGTPGQSFSVALLSGASRRGMWVVPPAYTAVAFMGGVQLDLRDARFAQREVTIRAFAVMGGIEITVPEDVNVVVDGVGIMGGFDETGAHMEARPGQPVVRVTGLAFWGGVEVKRKPRKKPKDKSNPAIEA
ncbi:DUF1707 SHOCT-like domain-containing protein [Actinopolymorpha alba]|uniref:DUF1707 SHOCT-like domain-containing protein n=1 Tax=Actinopolymorpha alba TaxID=533267 RepID=UPI000382204B|nr:DUF1707 domain-containing protein [Actinopolymorpha alba]